MTCTTPGCKEECFSIKRSKRGDTTVKQTVSYKKCHTHWAKQFSNDSLPDRYLNKYGYARIKVDGHFKAEHRVVMEEKLGRKLLTGESVHHINGKRDDNRPDNLELWLGAIRYGQRAKDIVCPHCAKPYLL